MSETDLTQPPIGLTIQVRISKVEDDRASIVMPPEIRLTPDLLAYIKLALAERGLELAHMDITEVHRKELENLPDVIIQDKKASE